jgi:PPOX class probable F420-dependent enzyme
MAARALTEVEIRLLTEPNFAIVGVLRDDGSIHQSVVWVDWDGEQILLNTREGRAKPHHLRKDPRISVLVIDRQDPYRWLSVEGTARVDEADADEHIERLSRKYTGDDWERTEGEQRLLIRVDPVRVTTYGLE